MRKVSILIALLASSGALFACAPGEDRSAADQLAAPSAPASEPSIEIVHFAELETALARERGQGLLLNFWAIWCGPCVAELPELIEVARAHRPAGGRVVGVSFDLMLPEASRTSVEADMRAFAKKRGLDYPVLIYDEDDFSALEERYGVGGEIPVTLAIDARGTIVDRQVGRAGRERFEEMMRTALGLAR